MSLVYHVVLTSNCFFFFNDTATTEIYTLSLHDALPISPHAGPGVRPVRSATRTKAARRPPDGVFRARRGLPRDRHGGARGLARVGTGARGARHHRRAAVLGTGPGDQGRAIALAGADRRR